MRSIPMRSSLLAVAVLLVATGCQLKGVPTITGPLMRHNVRSVAHGTPGLVRSADLLPVPASAAAAGSSRFVTTSGGGSLSGRVEFALVEDATFDNSAANYRLQAAVGPHANGLVNLSNLEEQVYFKDGAAVSTTTAATGGALPLGEFALTGTTPTGSAYVLNANMFQGHRLSGLVAADHAGSKTVDEASSMVAELARWQIREADLQAMPAADVADLEAKTRAAWGALAPADLTAFVAANFAQPSVGSGIPALRAGAGFVLRNVYVTLFGSRIADGGATAFDDLAEAVKTHLGFRPLALTRVAGNGSRGYNSGDGADALTKPMSAPSGVATDASGNLYIAESDGHIIRFVPKTTHTPTGVLGTCLGGGAVTQGQFYTLGGVPNGGLSDATSYESSFGSAAFDNAAAGTYAPLLSDAGTLLFNPTKIVVKQVGANVNLYFTSRANNRVFVVPGLNQTEDAALGTLYGQTMAAGRVYPLAGTGTAASYADYYSENPAPAGDRDLYTPSAMIDGTQMGNVTPVSAPTGLAVSDTGEVYFVNSGNGVAAMVATDGTLAAITSGWDNLEGAQDLLLLDDPTPANRSLFVADTQHHKVIGYYAGPASVGDPYLPYDNWMGSLAGQNDAVSGDPLPGFTKGTFPLIYDLFAPVPAADALVNAPAALALDRAGNLLIGEKGRIRLIESADVQALIGGPTYSSDAATPIRAIAGGLDTTYVKDCDARLAFLRSTSALALDPDGNVLVADNLANTVSKLWTARGTF